MGFFDRAIWVDASRLWLRPELCGVHFVALKPVWEWGYTARDSVGRGLLVLYTHFFLFGWDFWWIDVIELAFESFAVSAWLIF